MCLTRLALENFATIASVALKLDGRHVCLYGVNGSGKTNLIEAVSMLSPGRGLRGADLTDIVRARARRAARARNWALSADLRDNDVDRKLHLSLELDDQGRSKRTAKLDGAPATQAELGELVRVIWLTPSMDRVFAGPAGDRPQILRPSGARPLPRPRPRRRRLRESDAPAQCAPGAGQARSRLARRAGAAHGREPAPSWPRTVQTRWSASRAAIEAAPKACSPRPWSELEGRFEQRALEGADIAQIEQELASALKLSRTRDQVAGRALEGVHRTDLRVFHAVKGLPADQCSTGEQKALLTGLDFCQRPSAFRA